jgi:hypothetical protein
MAICEPRREWVEPIRQAHRFDPPQVVGRIDPQVGGPDGYVELFGEKDPSR